MQNMFPSGTALSGPDHMLIKGGRVLAASASCPFSLTLPLAKADVRELKEHCTYPQSETFIDSGG